MNHSKPETNPPTPSRQASSMPDGFAAGFGFGLGLGLARPGSVKDTVSVP